MDYFDKSQFNDSIEEFVTSLEELVNNADGEEWEEWLETEVELSLVSADWTTKVLPKWIAAFEYILHKDPLNYKNWYHYFVFLDKLLKGQDDYGLKFINEKMGLGLEVTKYDIKNSHKILFHCHKFWLENGLLENIKELYASKLQIPLLQTETVFNKFSSFVSQYFPNDYSEIMKSASNLKSKSESLRSQLVSWEERIDEEGDTNFQIWLDYINWLNKRKVEKTLKTGLSITTFERAIRKRDYHDIQWIELWKRYISVQDTFTQYTLYKRLVQDFAHFNVDVYVTFFLQHGIQTYEPDCKLPKEISDNTVKHLENTSVADSTFLELAVLYLSAFWKLLGKAEEIAQFEEETVEIMERVFHASLKRHLKSIIVEKLCINILKEVNIIDKADSLIELLIKQDSNRLKYEAWSFGMSTLVDPKKKHSIYLEALQNMSSFDFPNKAQEFLLTYQVMNRLPFAFAEFRACLDVPNKMEESNIQNELGSIVLQPRKRKAENEINGNTKRQITTRDREHLKVKILGLPNDISREDIANLLQVEGIRDITQVNGDVTVELSSEEEVERVLTKSGEEINGQRISVERAIGTTVWVTNYPPEYEKHDIESLFSGHDLKIMGIRLPSLKTNVNRRFCYVEFLEESMANLAVEHLNGKELKGSDNRVYKVTVKISDPSKAERSNKIPAAIEEGKELFVNRLNFYKVDEDKLKRTFSKFGSVVSVKLPLSVAGRQSNRLNDGYGFIIFSSKEEASKALEMNGQSIAGHSIGVTLAQQKTQPNRNKKIAIEHSDNRGNKPFMSKAKIAAKTITIKNLDDTVTSARVKEISKEYGPVYKVVLIPEKNGAYVEFETEASAGKCQMAMNGKEIGNSIVTIVPGFALDDVEVKTFDLHSSEEVESSNKTGITNEESKTTKKARTNDDFRAMMLGLKN